MSDRPTATHKEAGGSARGASLADKLERIGVLRDEDLVLHLPLRY